MVAGDLVNTASRIQSVAEPGTVLVGESTRRATEQTVVYEEAGAHELKGKEGRTPLWRALRVVSGVRGSLKSNGLEAPFVGRDRELRQIKDLFHACAEEKKAHLVSVTGIAGIGKSRLGWEFYKYFDGHRRDGLLAPRPLPRLRRGRDLLGARGHGADALPDRRGRAARRALEKLRATLASTSSTPEERGFVEPRLAQLLGLWAIEARRPAGPVRRLAAVLRAAGRALLRRCSCSRTCSGRTRACSTSSSTCSSGRGAHPLFVVTLARPELLERRPTWGAGQRSFTSLYLEPLPPQAMEELLSGLVPGLPAELRDQILARAEGVPLYAVETVRMLLDRGLLVAGRLRRTG